MSTVERIYDNTAEITAHGDANTDKIIGTVQRGFEKLFPNNINIVDTWDDTVPCTKRLKISESNPISDYSGMACFGDVNF